jgi:hypothetical protein
MVERKRTDGLQDVPLPGYAEPGGRNLLHPVVSGLAQRRYPAVRKHSTDWPLRVSEIGTRIVVLVRNVNKHRLAQAIPVCPQPAYRGHRLY